MELCQKEKKKEKEEEKKSSTRLAAGILGTISEVCSHQITLSPHFYPIFLFWGGKDLALGLQKRKKTDAPGADFKISWIHFHD